jgi:hypothetical protein
MKRTWLLLGGMAFAGVVGYLLWCTARKKGQVAGYPTDTSSPPLIMRESSTPYPIEVRTPKALLGHRRDSAKMQELKLTTRKRGDVVQTSVDVCSVVRKHYAGRPQESLLMVGLNNHNDVVALVEHSRGTKTESLVDPALFYAPAILANATSAVMVHNHPSGHLTPSSSDQAVVKRLSDAGNILGIKFIDSIIMNSGGDELGHTPCQSMRSLGLVP